MEKHHLFDFSKEKVLKLSNRNAYILQFFQNERIYFNGKARICVVRGTIEVFGYKMIASNEYFTFIVPFSSPSLYIEPKSYETNQILPTSLDEEVNQTLKEKSLPYAVAAIVVEECNYSIPSELEFLLHSSESSQKLDLKNFFPIIRELEEQNKLVIPEQWGLLRKTLLESNGIELNEKGKWKAPITVITGSKNVGKSTLAKFLVNSLLSKYKTVAFLESDIGQCEFVTPGNISLLFLSSPLFNPPWINTSLNPEQSYFIGNTTAKENPIYFKNCLQKLFDYYMKHTSTSPFPVPLIINTHGWTQGLGLDLTVDLIKYTKPLHLIQIVPPPSSTTPRSSEVIDFNSILRDISFPLALHTIPSAFRLSESSPRTSFTANDRRNAQIISYFSTSIKSNIVYKLPWSQLQLRSLTHKFPASHALKAINGSIVSLSSSISNTKLSPHKLLSIEMVGEEDLPSVGMGLVKAVDLIQKCLYICTPVSKPVLESVDTLILGDYSYVPPILGAVVSDDFVINGKETPIEDAPYTHSGSALRSYHMKNRGVKRKSSQISEKIS